MNIKSPDAIVYPESDGLPMADNTLQYDWVTKIKGSLEVLFRDRDDVFVAGDLLWYPVEGEPKICIAPDALVAFGRPRGYRGCYKQWEEAAIAPQVVFEVLSLNNTAKEMERKLEFYDRHGVQEYYVFDPDTHQLTTYHRHGAGLVEQPETLRFKSPLLGVTLDRTSGEREMFTETGERFMTFEENAAARLEAIQKAASEAKRAESERRRAETERKRADAEKKRADALAEKLRQLGVDPDA